MDYYDRDGNALTMRAWVQLFESWDADGRENYRRVGSDNLDENGENVWVSTVWVGLDHSFTPDTRHIFETMPFGGEHHEQTWRWCSVEHALAGHIAVVAYLLKEGDEPEQCWGHLRPDERQHRPSGPRG